ncbi:cupin domain-containing protein [Massilia sp. TS11]|uniref:cupin domain-containing protein n=1 Tax=Massilia sp. TS11 TaxID=2908003 RepID=UPI001EDA5A7F|nr:cupin domain-containing protein [Massilia sp. TS11]MCG2584496.1 cupin domain-containing protein [Massilia sp. TS11]
MKPVAVTALEVAPRAKPSILPGPFAPLFEGREKRALGDVFGLTNFGINLTRLQPGGKSALPHAHARQDEFVYVLAGTLTLITDGAATTLTAGMCAGFAAGSGVAHHMENRSDSEAMYLEIGDRTRGDQVSYPHEDLAASMGEDGAWRFTRKDGSPL